MATSNKVFAAVTLCAGYFLAWQSAFGCSCAPPPPACQAVGQTQFVFLGTVTAVDTPSAGFKTARMHIDHAFKGSLKETVELFDDGMCDGPMLEAGHQYLMYTFGDPVSPMPARGCNRSRRVEDAAEDLEFLKLYAAGRAATYVGGRVIGLPDAQSDDDDLPLKGAMMTLSGKSGKATASTDALGLYRFSNVKPGVYELQAELPGYRVQGPAVQVSLRSNGCIEEDFLMKVDRRVEGVVRDENGEPVVEALVEMVSTNSRLNRREQPVLLSVSDELGRYVVDGIPAGEYYLGINIESTPTKEHPYAPTYYPSGRDTSQATKLTIPVAASVQNIDLRVAGKLPLITIHGRILKADDIPPGVADQAQVRIKESGVYGQIETEPIHIDTDGRFSFELCEGVSYSAFAFIGHVPSATYSAPVEFVPTQKNDQLELVLDKSAAEFRELTSNK